MSRKIIVVFFLLCLNLFILSASNLSINSDLMKNYTVVKFDDNINLIGVEFENNKVLGLNTLKIEQNKAKISKFSLFENKNLFVDKKNRYFLSIESFPLTVSSTISLFNKDGIDLSTIKYKSENIQLSTSYFYSKNKDFNSFYYDFSSLLYTKQGLITDLFLKYKFVTLESEVALAKYGTFWSYSANCKFKKVNVFFNTKNINEKYKAGFTFTSDNVKVEVIHKIYNISAYGGQGVKRNYSIDGNLKFNFKKEVFKSTLYFSTYHEIDYDVYLNKSIKQKFKVRQKIEGDNNNYEWSFSYSDGFSTYIVINCFKLVYDFKKVDLQFLYTMRKKDNSLKIQLSTSGMLKLSYNYSL